MWYSKWYNWTDVDIQNDKIKNSTAIQQILRWALVIWPRGKINDLTPGEALSNQSQQYNNI